MSALGATFVTMRTEEIKALISLLDDPDTEIYLTVEEKILALGDPIIANLEEAWENSFNNTLQNRIEGIIHKIQLSSLTAAFEKWATEGENDLLAGALLVARYQYPDLDEKFVRQQLDNLKKEVWLELNDNLTALEKVHVFNRVLFDIHNYSGNKRNYHAPKNSYINHVLESRKGSPLTLSIIYMVIAHELKIPIYGINLPEHFVLGYAYLPRNMVRAFAVDDVLFYINPFNKGQVFSKVEIDRFLEEINLPQAEHFYLPCSNLDVVKRLLRNLVYSYKKMGDAEKEQELTLLLDSF